METFILRVILIVVLFCVTVVPVVRTEQRKKKAKEERMQELDYLAKKIAEEQAKTKES